MMSSVVALSTRSLQSHVSCHEWSAICRVAALPCVAERTLTMFALQHTGCLQQLKTITGLSGAWYVCQWPVLAASGWVGPRNIIKSLQVDG